MPTENPPSLDPEYITGLVEGEGCFAVSFSLRKKLKLGVETRPSFSISLNQKDLSLLQSVHRFFGCGAIRYSKGDRTYKYESRSVSDLAAKIIPHFQRYPLQGAKGNDFRLFCEICRMVQANKHRNRQSLSKIFDLAYEMNPSGKRRYEKQKLLRVLDEMKV